MTNSKKTHRYSAPEVHLVVFSLERGFATSAESGFEQPEYGGAENL